MEKAELEFIINHVFLPPKLPQAEEPERCDKESVLLHAVLDAVLEFNSIVENAVDGHQNEVKSWGIVKRMIGFMWRLHSSEGLRRSDLVYLLKNLQIGGEFCWLLF